MTHALTLCDKDVVSLVVTDVPSFIYTCPECGKQRRFADRADGSEVFCDGDDLGTKMYVADEIMEVSVANFITEAFATDTAIAADDLGLVALGYMQETPDGMFELTTLGKQIFEELR